MLAKLSQKELAMWRVYFARYPFSDERSDFAMGSIRHTLYECHLTKNVPKLEECISSYDPKPKAGPMSAKAIQNMIRPVLNNLPAINQPRPKDGSN